MAMPLSPQTTRVESLLRKGKSNQEIATAVGIPSSRVSNIKNRMRVREANESESAAAPAAPVRSNGSGKHSADHERILELIRAGKSNAEIMAATGAASKTVYNQRYALRKKEKTAASPVAAPAETATASSSHLVLAAKLIAASGDSDMAHAAIDHVLAIRAELNGHE